MKDEEAVKRWETDDRIDLVSLMERQVAEEGATWCRVFFFLLIAPQRHAQISFPIFF